MSGPFHSQRFLAWEHVRFRIDEKLSFLEPLQGKPHVDIFFDAHKYELGIEVSDDSRNLPSVNAAALEIAPIENVHGPGLRMSIREGALFREFYDFALDVADRCQVEGDSVCSAIESAWEAWTQFLNRKKVLSRDSEIGLLGELWLLEEIAEQSCWETALTSWHQEMNAEHDFSLPSLDIEVKSTTSEFRVHVVNSANQLLPTLGRPLYVLSIQLTIAPTGTPRSRSLSGEIARISENLEGGVLKSTFKERLKNVGWREEDDDNYRTAFLLRTQPVLIPVDETFPRLTQKGVDDMYPGNPGRIDLVSYRIRLDGLGASLVSDKVGELLLEGDE